MGREQKLERGSFKFVTPAQPSVRERAREIGLNYISKEYHISGYIASQGEGLTSAYINSFL